MNTSLRIPLSAPDIVDADIDAVVEVLRTPRLSLGPKLVEFERAVAEFAEVRHAVAVNSGTSALHLAVRGLGIGVGDEVITSAFSFVASANAIVYEGARPVFVDIDPSTLNLDLERLDAARSPRTKALMVVHVFARPAPMDPLLEFASRHGLAVIEDACEAIGGEYLGRKLGGLGDAGAYAFYPNKQITTGEGGVLVTDDDRLAALAESLRNQGRDAGDSYAHTELGYNYRLSEINCALGLRQLDRLASILERREAVARRYHQRLSGHPGLILPPLREGQDRISWFVFVVRLGPGYCVADRDRIARQLTDRGIGCGRYFPAIHLQPFYRREFGYKGGELPQTERAAEHTLALPFFNRITDEQIDEVCDALLELIGS
jgi:perosamine synthetase